MKIKKIILYLFITTFSCQKNIEIEKCPEMNVMLGKDFKVWSECGKFSNRECEAYGIKFKGKSSMLLGDMLGVYEIETENHCNSLLLVNMEKKYTKKTIIDFLPKIGKTQSGKMYYCKNINSGEENLKVFLDENDSNRYWFVNKKQKKFESISKAELKCFEVEM